MREADADREETLSRLARKSGGDSESKNSDSRSKRSRDVPGLGTPSALGNTWCGARL